MRNFALATVAALGIGSLTGCLSQPSGPNIRTVTGGPTTAPSVVATAAPTPETPPTATTYPPPALLAPVR